MAVLRPDGGSNNRRVDMRPCRDIQRGVVVSSGGIAALEAAEVGLIGTVALVAVATDATGTRRIAGVHVDDAHPGGKRLVGDELPQLEESPRTVLPPLLVANVHALTNPLEILKRECLARRSSFADQCLAHDVVDVALKAGLAPRTASQSCPCPACVLLLEA